jgi:hypothetical protein
MPIQLASLPAEILVVILSAATSTSDVLSLICASSTSYKAFVPAKRIVFSNILAKELGSAVRDALAIVLFFPGQISNIEAALQAVQQYADLPIPDLRSEQGGVSYEQILQIAFWARIVQDLVDNYAAFRLPELRKVHSDAAGPLTAMERRRIARAILRHQILARMHDFGHGTAGMVYRREHVANRLFSMWPPWEMQQLADVSGHIVTMATFAVQYLLRGTGPPARVALRVPEREESVHDLGILHKRLTAAVAEAAIVPYGSPAVKPSEDIEMHVGQYFLALTWTGRLRRGASDTVTEDRRPMCYEVLQELYEIENAAARLVFAQESDHHDGSAPFAWVDGHGGIDCQRWSDYVHRKVLPEEHSLVEPAYIRQTTGQWRWMGFVFWDRPRVEMLKSRLSFPATGWFISPPPSRRKCRALVKRFEPRRRR